MRKMRKKLAAHLQKVPELAKCPELAEQKSHALNSGIASRPFHELWESHNMRLTVNEHFYSEFQNCGLDTGIW